MKEFLGLISRQEGVDWQYVIEGESVDRGGFATVHVFSDGVSAIAFIDNKGDTVVEGMPVDWDPEFPVESAIAAALALDVVPGGAPQYYPYTPSRAEAEIAREFYFELVERDLMGARR